MKMIFWDAETYYDKEYSLRKMTPAEYILDERFELICVSAQVDNGEIETIDGPDFPAWLAQFDPADTVMVAYNSLFDQCIAAWRYRFVPRSMIDGLGMARALLGYKLRSLSLEKVAEFLKLGVKGSTVKTVLGMRRQDIIDAGLWPDFLEYNKQDVRLLRGVFNFLMPHFPRSELKVMDLVLRCCVEPRFVMNIPKLEAHYAKVCADKDRLIMEAFGGDVTQLFDPVMRQQWLADHKAQLMSTAEFAKVLEQLGVEVLTKPSAAGNDIPALAKTDDFMNSLVEHDDPAVQAVAAARLGVKSTLEEKRCERLLAIAKLPWHLAGLPVGTMPIPLRYAGAHTQRLSGDWKINMQNLPTGRGTGSSALRDALEAPPGHKVVVCDLSQIEARLTAWFTKAPLLQVFLAGKDPYCAMASKIFGFEVTKANEIERFVGKSAVLGLGFGLGAKNFYIKTAAAARAQGLSIGNIWTENLAKKTVQTYRADQAPTVVFWEMLNNYLELAWCGKHSEVTLGDVPAEPPKPAIIGPIAIGHNYGYGYVKGPGGLCMFYDNEPRPDVPTCDDIWYRFGERWKKIYGAALLENIIQFLARIVQMDAAVRLALWDEKMRLAAANSSSAAGYLRPVHTVHDELIFIVPDNYVDTAKKIVHMEMTRRPSWGRDIPIKAEVGSGQSYGDAK